MGREETQKGDISQPLVFAAGGGGVRIGRKCSFLGTWHQAGRCRITRDSPGAFVLMRKRQINDHGSP